MCFVKLWLNVGNWIWIWLKFKFGWCLLISVIIVMFIKFSMVMNGGCDE